MVKLDFSEVLRMLARELGFSERGVGRAYHDGRNRIGQYELEWLETLLEPEPVEEPPKIKPRRKPRNTTGEKRRR